MSPDDRLEPRGTLPARLKVRMYVVSTIIVYCHYVLQLLPGYI